MKVYRLDDSESFFPQIVPMVDIVLLVLIFFLITATYTTIPQQLDVSLPETEVTDGPAATEVRLFLAADGRVRLAGEWLEREQLEEAFQRLSADIEQPVILISADSRSRHQWLVDVMSGARAAGIEDFGFEVTLRGRRPDG